MKSDQKNETRDMFVYACERYFWYWNDECFHVNWYLYWHQILVRNSFYISLDYTFYKYFGICFLTPQFSISFVKIWILSDEIKTRVVIIVLVDSYSSKQIKYFEYYGWMWRSGLLLLFWLTSVWIHKISR